MFSSHFINWLATNHLESSEVFLPPEVFLVLWSQSSQQVVSVHDNMYKCVEQSKESTVSSWKSNSSHSYCHLKVMGMIELATSKFGRHVPTCCFQLQDRRFSQTTWSVMRDNIITVLLLKIKVLYGLMLRHWVSSFQCFEGWGSSSPRRTSWPSRWDITILQISGTIQQMRQHRRGKGHNEWLYRCYYTEWGRPEWVAHQWSYTQKCGPGLLAHPRFHVQDFQQVTIPLPNLLCGSVGASHVPVIQCETRR